MRCSTCGTDNEADSRFCGGCGARLTPSRLAPTHKITDNAPLQAAAAAVGRAQPVAPAQPAQPVLPRTSNAERPPAVSQPPPFQPVAPSVNRPPRSSNEHPAYAATPQNGVPEIPAIAPVRQRSMSVDESLPPPKRKWGLIIGVLIIDLGLAGAGAWMLSEGLADSPSTSSTSSTSTPAPPKKP